MKKLFDRLFENLKSFFKRISAFLAANAKKTAVIVLSALLTFTALAMVFVGAGNKRLPEYEMSPEFFEAGIYMQQYTYNLFKLDSLFISKDTETEELTTEPQYAVVVNDAGVRSTYYSKDKTVEAFFEDQYISLGEEDSMNVEYTDLISQCGEIEINRVGYSLQTEIQYTAYKTETYRVFFLAAVNRIPEDTAGRRGQTRVSYRCKYVDGELVEKVQVNKTVISRPVNEVKYVIYHPEWEPYGLDMSYVVKTVEYGSTAYSSQQKNLGECTAMGYQTDYGIAAVSYRNPGEIRMGDWVYVECIGLDFDYGYAYVCDTSHSYNPTWMDLHFDTVYEARVWGRRRIRVHLLSGRPDFVDPPERYKRK
ncbi:MAG: G5 domain-containing protein [Clostridia bacterium]|nr:G5 domain-containing protein [Clostridia bacterium]